MPTHVYIDGLNFYYGAVRKTPYKWIDFEALARRLVPHDTIGKIRYFTAVVTPRYATDRAHERQNTLLRALDASPLIKVHRGHFRSDVKWRTLADNEFPLRNLFRPALTPHTLARIVMWSTARTRSKPFGSVRVVIDEEKGSDVNLGSYLLYDALTGACDKAIVLTNDSDLAEPIRLVASRGIKVGIVNPSRNQISRHLRNAATFEIPFRQEIVSRCQLPHTVQDKKGREIHCPKEWR